MPFLSVLVPTPDIGDTQRSFVVFDPGHQGGREEGCECVTMIQFRALVEDSERRVEKGEGLPESTVSVKEYRS